MSALILFVFLILLIFSIPAIIFLIAYLAAQSRKKKQNALLAQLPLETKLTAVVRYNKGQQQTKFLKLKAFQGSGVIYVLDNKIHFRDTLDQNPYEFDLATAQIRFVGVTLANGALNWFTVSDGETEYFFNVESGMFIWHTSSGKMTTKEICDKLQQLQLETAPEKSLPQTEGLQYN